MFHLLSSEKEHTEHRVLCKPHMSFFFFSLQTLFPLVFKDQPVNYW